MSELNFLAELEALIRQRLSDAPEGSYTAKLAARGIQAAAQKVGEEGVEVALAATAGPDGEVIAESADLVYHLLLVLALRGIGLDAVTAELEQRHREREAK